MGFECVQIRVARKYPVNRAFAFVTAGAQRRCYGCSRVLEEVHMPHNTAISMKFISSLFDSSYISNVIPSFSFSFDFASVFKYKMTTYDEFCEKFPDSDDQLDFHVLDVRCSNGRYKGNNITTLFSDLELMIANGKQFNDENKDFQPWRLCDMMEKKVADLKIRLDTRVVAPSTSSSSSSCGSSSSSSSSSLLHSNNKKHLRTDSSDNHLTPTFDGEAEETADLDALEQEEV